MIFLNKIDFKAYYVLKVKTKWNITRKYDVILFSLN